MKSLHSILIRHAMLLMVLLAGCASEVSLRSAGANAYPEYVDAMLPRENFTVNTINLLGNYLLTGKLSGDPEAFMVELEALARRDGREDFQVAIGEVALYYSQKYSGEPERAARFSLTSLIYSYRYLVSPRVRQKLFDPALMVVTRNYNLALTDLFAYLKNKELHLVSGFELSASGGQTVCFKAPHFALPVAKERIQEYLLCADFRPVNLTHSGRRVGVGVPLICRLDKNNDPADPVLAAVQSIPATALLICPEGFGGAADERVDVKLCFIDTKKYNIIGGNNLQIPIEQDFSTPLAYVVKNRPIQNFLLRTLLPENSKDCGLYLLEPRDPDKIPVLFVHGLMSDLRTWLQMINTLQSDPVLRRHYRFMGFSYSSGNPIFYSAYMLRKSLLEERDRMVKAGSNTEKFDRMVVVGHSMGGMLSRLLISSSTGDTVSSVLGGSDVNELLSALTAEQKELVRQIVFFEPFSSVQRAIFIAAPHRGSAMAGTWYGRLGTSLIHLPAAIIDRNRQIFSALLRSGLHFDDGELKHFNGIRNLMPDGLAVRMLGAAKLPEIPYHTIVGNEKMSGVPGGSDGVVPYSSSHLDGAKSELVVHSGHSAQQNALAIQEVRRILLEHLKGYSEYRNEPEELPFSYQNNGNAAENKQQHGCEEK